MIVASCGHTLPDIEHGETAALGTWYTDDGEQVRSLEYGTYCHSCMDRIRRSPDEYRILATEAEQDDWLDY